MHHNDHVEGDRLSSLPDDLIHKILSFITIKQAIETSVLSSRWRFIWTSMPYLNFSRDGNPFNVSTNFVSNVLSRRNNQIQVSSVKLIQWGNVSHEFVKKVVDYAESYNVQQLTFNCPLVTKKDGFLLSVFRSKSLKNLVLYDCSYPLCSYNVAPTWELPSLTTLYLERITLFVERHTDNCIGDIFSKCTNLKNLSLIGCRLEGTHVLNISHPILSNLTLDDISNSDIVNVVTPQLKNLAIKFCDGKHLISAPGLTSLVMTCGRPWQLSTKGFPSLENVYLYMFNKGLADAHGIVCLLQQLHTVKFLRLNWELLEFLSSSKELISHQPPAFPNLKISKFYTKTCVGLVMGHVELAAQEKITTTIELKNHDSSPSAIFTTILSWLSKYLGMVFHDSSPSSIFTMISCQEIKVMRDMVSTEKLFEELRFRIEKFKAKNDTNNANMTSLKRKNGKVRVKKHRVQSAFETQWHFGEMMAQIEQRKIEGLPTLETRNMITKLKGIERLVTSKLPESRRAAMQAKFSSMCEEAAILMNNIMDEVNKLRSLD